MPSYAAVALIKNESVFAMNPHGNEPAYLLFVQVEAVRTIWLAKFGLNRYGVRERRVSGTVTYALQSLLPRIKKIIL